MSSTLPQLQQKVEALSRRVDRLEGPRLEANAAGVEAGATDPRRGELFQMVKWVAAEISAWQRFLAEARAVRAALREWDDLQGPERRRRDD